LSPITLVVSNINNSGIGSLRQAILEAGSTDGDRITFASNVIGTIALTNGELVVGKSLTIQGPGSAPVIVSGNNASRVFRVTSSSKVNVSSLTISNGNTGAQGAGFYNDFGCTLALSNCAVVANISGDNGGGVANNGSFAAYNCTFANNRAFYTGGGIYTMRDRSLCSIAPSSPIALPSRTAAGCATTARLRARVLLPARLWRATAADRPSRCHQRLHFGRLQSNRAN
jgi:predicted outer membrane repeat protein